MTPIGDRAATRFVRAIGPKGRLRRLAELDDDPDAFAKALLRLRRTDRRRPPRSVRTQWDVADVPVSGFDMFVMSPRHADPSASVILYLHGGGYLLGPFGTEWSAMRKIAAGAGSDFAMLMYPRAPEHPATTTLEVACAAYDELTMRYPSRQVVLAGTSTGGGLALALMAQLRDDGGPVPRCAVLVSPGVDMPLRDDASPYEDADALLSIAHVRSAGKVYARALGADHPTVSRRSENWQVSRRCTCSSEEPSCCDPASRILRNGPRRRARRSNSSSARTTNTPARSLRPPGGPGSATPDHRDHAKRVRGHPFRSRNDSNSCSVGLFTTPGTRWHTSAATAVAVCISCRVSRPRSMP